MISTIVPFLAQAAASSPAGAPQPQGLMGALPQLLPLVFIFVIFYFLLIRPQQKKQKDHEKLVSQIKTGDKVVTNAGIHGIIANVKDKTVILKVADNVKIEMERSAVVTVEKGSEIAAETV